ncbi:MAG: nitroreductase family protein [Thermoleophilia bacterium]|nr:nitroreductase family protein [Thermoleophilia bacterium]
MQYEELLGLMKSRRTVRAIKPDPVPDDVVGKLLEVARWAPTGFNMQPAELMVVTDIALRTQIKKMVDDWVDTDFFALEATREEWQGPPWTAETHGRPECPLAPLFILILGDERRRAGLPMNARYDKHKCDSIFDSSLSNVFLYLWLAAQSLGLAAQPVSTVKSPKVQGLVRHLLDIPHFLSVYEMLVVGYSAMEGGPSVKLTRHLDQMVHYDRAGEGEFVSDEELKKEIRKLRAGNVSRHREASRMNEAEEA